MRGIPRPRSPDGLPTRVSGAPIRLLSVAALVVLAGLTGGWRSQAYAVAPATPVNAFPVPGSHFASPQAQVTFRGVPVSLVGTIVVSGARTGVHNGRIVADSDGLGGSFLPDRAFAAGELVTVSSGLNIVGGSAGSYQFRVADPAGRVASGNRPPTPRTRGDVLRFRSRPDLIPAAIRQTRRGRTAPGDIFLAPLAGPVQNGPMIIDQAGEVVWFKPLAHGDSATDFRAQTYRGKPVLTYWQGNVNASGLGQGEGVIDNTSYGQIAAVKAGNGLSADLHEFEITPQNTALVTAFFPVYADASAVKGGGPHRAVFDAVVQEIDIPTGLVLFQWDSLDHVGVADTRATVSKNAGRPFDYFHVNSVQQDADGSLIVSARNTWAAYKISRQTGQVLWVLGGRRSSFTMGKDAQFAYQHDVRVRRADDTAVTLFDDGAAPKVHAQSRGLTLRLNFRRKTASVIDQSFHNPALSASFEGNDELLPGGDRLLGWGQQPYFTEFNSRGKVVLDGHFVGPVNSYRTWRFQWSATPATLPAAAGSRGKAAAAYASWNGATAVARWRVLGGRSPHSLRALRTVRKRGFETRIPIKSQKYVEVQALDGKGHTLASSLPVPSR